MCIRDRQGDPVALEAFRYTGELLGRALADVVTVTSPEAIFLFGGLSKAGKLIFEPTQWYMEENMLFVFKNKVKLLPSGIQGKNAAILGASALIWQQENKYAVFAGPVCFAPIRAAGLRGMREKSAD